MLIFHSWSTYNDADAWNEEGFSSESVVEVPAGEHPCFCPHRVREFHWVLRRANISGLVFGHDLQLWLSYRSLLHVLRFVVVWGECSPSESLIAPIWKQSAHQEKPEIGFHEFKRMSNKTNNFDSVDLIPRSNPRRSRLDTARAADVSPKVGGHVYHFLTHPTHNSPILNSTIYLSSWVASVGHLRLRWRSASHCLPRFEFV